MGWKNNTPGDCCCVSFDDACPCFEGTLGAMKQSHVSGITYDPLTIFHPDINGSHNEDSASDCAIRFDTVFATNTSSFTSLGFTRADSHFVRAHDSPGQTFPLPPGVKALLVIDGSAVVPGGFGGEFAYSQAAFYKVLADVDGFVDCSLDLSGFTFLGQDDAFAGSVPLAGFEDASGSTVSYS